MRVRLLARFILIVGLAYLAHQLHLSWANPKTAVRPSEYTPSGALVQYGVSENIIFQSSSATFASEDLLQYPVYTVS